MFWYREGNLRQCCGNKVISITETCCGGSNDAIAHAYDVNKMCCGNAYVAKDTSMCCVDHVNRFKVILI